MSWGSAHRALEESQDVPQGHVRQVWPWADLLHGALLKERDEDLAVLLVDVSHPKVQGLYETWGYMKAGEQRPFADSPLYAVMVKSLS